MAAFKCSCVLLLLTVLSIYAQPKYKICAKHGFSNDCTQLARSPDAECEVNLHGIDCIHNIQQGRTHFGRITPQEAFIAANFVQDVVVIGEIRSDAIYDDSLYATVVLVKQDYTGGLKNLRGKKFCHPGFKYDETVSELLLKEFEREVLKTNNADICSSAVNSDTLAEKELKGLFEFFGPSCRPGPWSEADIYNKEFYNRYDRLCELCNNPLDKCTVPNGVAPFMYSLECLLKVDGGDVALTSLNTVKNYFEKPENQAKKTSYRYLCRDGSIQPLNTPCTWSRQPWNLIIANKNQAEDLKSAIEQKWLQNSIITLPNSSASVTPGNNPLQEDALKALLFTNMRSDKIYGVNSIPLREYFQAYRSIPDTKSSTLCEQEIRWCTVSNEEQEKCLWLAQASLDRTIQPVISCVKSESKLACLEDIKNDKADIVTSDAHYGYIARKKGLAPIAYPETDLKYVIKTLLVIKNKDADSIQGFESLKDKKSCFPEYGGIEWLAFINAGRAHNVLSKTTCDYGGLISQFLGDSCIPGSHDQEHEVSSSTDKDKLCKLCLPISTGTAVTCNTDDSNQYYGNKGALKCLNEVGDFAVITKADYPNIDLSQYRVLCQNGTLAANTGFDVDQDCAFSVTVDSEVVTKRKLPNKNKDLEVVLLNFERRFGTDRNKAFEVFNIFNNKLDLLFKDSTPGLVKTDSDSIFVKSYADMFAHTDQCTADPLPPDVTTTPRNSADNIVQTPIVCILTTLVMLFFSKLF